MEKKQTRDGSRTPISSLMELFLGNNILPRRHYVLTKSSNLDDVGIVHLPLYAIIFSFYDKIESMEVDKDPEDSNISHTFAFFLFAVQGI